MSKLNINKKILSWFGLGVLVFFVVFAAIGFLAPCGEGKFKNGIFYGCVDSCPDGKYGDNSTKKCVDSCPDGTYTDDTNKKCLQTGDLCYNNTINYMNGEKEKKINDSLQCETVCKDGFFLINGECFSNYGNGNARVPNKDYDQLLENKKWQIIDPTTEGGDYTVKCLNQSNQEPTQDSYSLASTVKDNLLYNLYNPDGGIPWSGYVCNDNGTVTFKGLSSNTPEQINDEYFCGNQKIDINSAFNQNYNTGTRGLCFYTYLNFDNNSIVNFTEINTDSSYKEELLTPIGVRKTVEFNGDGYKQTDEFKKFQMQIINSYPTSMGRYLSDEDKYIYHGIKIYVETLNEFKDVIFGDNPSMYVLHTYMNDYPDYREICEKLAIAHVMIVYNYDTKLWDLRKSTRPAESTVESYNNSDYGKPHLINNNQISRNTFKEIFEYVISNTL